MPIAINGSGTVTGISVGGLPDGIVDADMLASNAVTAGKLASGVGGKILQVVSATKTDTFTTSSSSYTDITGLSVAITPSSASSKVFLIVNLHGIGDASTQMYVEIFRTSDNTSICIGDTRSNRVRASLGTGYFDQDNDINSQGINFLDSPNTTSTFNYKLRTKTQGAGTVLINRSNQDHDSTQSGTLASTITAIEVAA